MVKPFIIAVDGIDYSGKSTLVNGLQRILPKIEPRTVTVGKFPSTGHYGLLARKAIGENDRTCQALRKCAHYLMQDFATTPQTLIESEVKEHRQVIIYDRYIVSCLASQGSQGYETVMNNINLLESVKPDIYILLTCDHKTACKRATAMAEDKWDNRLEESFMVSEEAYSKHNEHYRRMFREAERVLRTQCIEVDSRMGSDMVLAEAVSYIMPLIATTSTHYEDYLAINKGEGYVDRIYRSGVEAFPN